MFEQLVTMFRAFANQPLTELEVSISLRSAGKQFVPYEIVKLLAQKLPTYPDVVSFSPVTYTDCFYPGNIRVRAVVGKPPECVIKTKICSIHAKCAQKRQFDFHFTLKNEIPTQLPNSSTPPDLVRLQVVWEFQYKQAFSYFLKKVVSGTTMAVAAQTAPTYEFEIEVIPKSAYLSSHTHEEMADSLIAKTLAFIRESNEEELTMELNIIPKSLKLLQPVHGKRKYICKKKNKQPAQSDTIQLETQSNTIQFDINKLPKKEKKTKESKKTKNTKTCKTTKTAKTTKSPKATKGAKKNEKTKIGTITSFPIGI